MSKSANPTHIKDLRPDIQNRRKHNPRNIGMVVDALQKVGAARSIVIDEANVVHAGNGVVEAAAEAGITKVRVVEADGDELIAVKRRNLTPEQWRELAIYDNRAAELAEWDAEQLQADLDAGLDLQPWFSERELDRVMTDAVAAMAKTEADPVVEPPADPDGFRTFSCPITVDQERIIRGAIRAAKVRFGVETTGEAVAAALGAWAESAG